MALPAVRVPSLGGLHALADAVGAVEIDPHEIIVDEIDSLINAPGYVKRLLELQIQGWVCGQIPRILKVKGVARHLRHLSNEVVPGLVKNPKNMKLVKHLAARGNALRRLSVRSDGDTPAALIRLARPLSSYLTSSARPVLKRAEDSRWLAARLDDLSAQVKACLLAPVDLVGVPTVVVERLSEIQALGPAEKPRELQVRVIDALRHAPAYLDHILIAKGAGWNCYQEDCVRKVSSLSFLLLEVSGKLLPKLRRNPDDRRAVHRLRSRASKIAGLKRPAPPAALLLARPLGNKIRRTARSLLEVKHRDNPGWLLRQMEDMELRIQKCLDSRILMQDGKA